MNWTPVWTALWVNFGIFSLFAYFTSRGVGSWEHRNTFLSIFLGGLAGPFAVPGWMVFQKLSKTRSIP